MITEKIVTILLGTGFSLYLYLFVYLVGYFIHSKFIVISKATPVLITGVFSTFVVVMLFTYLILYIPSLAHYMSWLQYIVFFALLYLYRHKTPSVLKESEIVLFCVGYFMIMNYLFWHYERIGGATPANNFIQGMPIDLSISLFFAKSLFAEEVLVFGEWLGSDRPPLFAGAIIAFKPAFVLLEKSYIATGVALQLLVIPIILSFCKLVIGRDFSFGSKVLLYFVLLCTPLFLHNISFLWPKIFACIFLVIACYQLFVIDNLTAKTAFLIAASLSMAYLSHGGSAFAIIGIGVTYLVLKTSFSRVRYGILILIQFIIINMPWLYYQKIIQPPGDRLVKWQLLGYRDITDMSVIEVFKLQYANFGLTDLLERVLISIYRQFLWPIEEFFETTDLSNFVDLFTVKSFFSLSLSVGAFALPLMVVSFALFKNKSHRFLGWVLCFSLLSWMLLAYKGARNIHEGSYFIPILLMVIIFLFYLKRDKAFKFFLGCILIAQSILSLLIFEDYRKQFNPYVDLSTAQSIHGWVGGTEPKRSNYSGMKVLGSYIDSDKNTADFIVTLSEGSGFSFKMGPDSTDQSIMVIVGGKVVETFSGKNSKPNRWKKVYTGIYSDDLVQIRVVDSGTKRDQWCAILLNE